MSAISIKQLLEAGVHFGHQTHRWNPRMKEYIFGERNGIYIIDLQKTLRLFKDAVQFVSEISAAGKSVLFVGTKRQAQEAIEEEAVRCGMFFVNNRWLGGLLTNFTTIQNSIKRYKELESMRDDGFYAKLSKKEAARLERERKKLEKNLRGIKEMDRLPGAVFVVDSNREAIAVKEASKLGIPVVAIVDTNCDPQLIDYVIPGNDDALRAVRLFASTVSDAVRAGRAVYDAKVEAELKEAREKAAREAAQRRAEKKAREEAMARAKEAAQAKEAAAAKAAEAKREAEAKAGAESKAAESRAAEAAESKAAEAAESKAAEAETASQPAAESAEPPAPAAEVDQPVEAASEPVEQNAEPAVPENAADAAPAAAPETAESTPAPAAESARPSPADAATPEEPKEGEEKVQAES